MISFLSWRGVVVQTALPMCLRDQDLDGRCERTPRRSLVAGEGATLSRGAVHGVAAARRRLSRRSGDRLKRFRIDMLTPGSRREFPVRSTLLAAVASSSNMLSGRDIMNSEEPTTTAETSTNRRLPLWLIMLGSGLFAGALAAIGGEITYPALHREPDYPARLSSLSSSERAVVRAVVRFKTRMAVVTNQATVAYGMLGVAVGVVLGLAGGLTVGSRRASQEGAVVGGISGAVAGAGLSMAAVPLFFEISDSMTSAPLLLLTHAVIFTGVGAAGGAGLGRAWGGRKVIVRCVLGGIMGAVLATIAVDVINVASSGVMRIFEPVPAERAPGRGSPGNRAGPALGAARPVDRQS